MVNRKEWEHIFLIQHRDVSAARDNAKLTEAKVKDMRKRYSVGDITQKALAIEFGITQTHVSRIILGIKWREM